MRKLKLIASSALLSTGLFLANPIAAFAQDRNISLNPSTEFAPLKNVTFGGVISGMITLVFILAAIIFFFILVIGGIQWITSGGDKTGAEGARKRITNALIGLAIVFVAWAIMQLMGTMFGINIMNFVLPTFTGNGN